VSQVKIVFFRIETIFVYVILINISSESNYKMKKEEIELIKETDMIQLTKEMDMTQVLGGVDYGLVEILVAKDPKTRKKLDKFVEAFVKKFTTLTMSEAKRKVGRKVEIETKMEEIMKMTGTRFFLDEYLQEINPVFQKVRRELHDRHGDTVQSLLLKLAREMKKAPTELEKDLLILEYRKDVDKVHKAIEGFMKMVRAL
jgi:hypothetical protein